MPVHGSPCDCAADRSAVCQSRRQNSGDFVQFSLTFCATLPRNPLTPLFFREPGSLPNDVSTIHIDNVKFERIRGHEQRPTSTCGRWRRSPWQNSQANLNNSGVKWDGLRPYNAGSLSRSVDTAPNLGKGGFARCRGVVGKVLHEAIANSPSKAARSVQRSAKSRRVTF